MGMLHIYWPRSFEFLKKKKENLFFDPRDLLMQPIGTVRTTLVGTTLGSFL